MSQQNQPTEFELYKIALDTRNMEISLFWQRSNYFLVLNTAVAVGFFNVGGCYQISIGLFGIVISILWIRINLGSKFWQSRWEWRLREAEESLNKSRSIKIEYFSASWESIKCDVKQDFEFSKHGKFRKLINELILYKNSVSFMMILLSLVFMLFWVVLFIMALFMQSDFLKSLFDIGGLCNALAQTIANFKN